MKIKKLLRKFLFYASIVALIGSFFSLTDGAGVFFSKLSNGIADYNVISESQLKKNLPMQGTVYNVYGCVAVKYDESSGEDTDYYYLIEFDEEKDLYMILQVKADTQLDVDMDEFYNASILQDDVELLEAGVETEGVLVENDTGVVKKFNEWKKEESDNGIDTSGYTLVDYTYDCSYPISSFQREFITGSIIFLVAIAALVFAVILYLKTKISIQGGNPADSTFIPQQNYGGQVPQNQLNQNNYYPQNNQQPNYPQMNVPIPTNLNPNSQNQNNTSFNSNSFSNSSPNGGDSSNSIYGSEQKVSLNKNDY